MKKEKRGRKSVMTEQVIIKLEQAYAFGASDKEACFYADIAPATLYKYQEKNIDFMERKELLKSRPILEARQSVVEHMKTDGALALKFLERKRRKEFALREEITGKNGDSIEMNTSLTYMPKQLPDGYWKHAASSDTTDNNSQ